MILFNINKELLPIKAHYFLWNAGFAHLKSFLGVYIKDLGFSGFTMGIIFTILPITGILGKPSMGWVADKFKCQKILFSFAVLLAGAATVSLLYVPKIDEDDAGEDTVYGNYIFWTLLILMMVSYLAEAMVVSISDTICFEVLGKKANKYGQQRCFGSLGWGIFSLIAGLIMDSGSNPDGKNYTATFYTGAGILVLDFIITLMFKYEQKPGSRHILANIGQLMKYLKTIIFSLWCILLGIFVGLIWNFLFWLVEDLNDNRDRVKTLEGILMSVQCLAGELPFFFLSGWIMNKLGHINTMSLILFAWSLRFILYSVIPDPWYFIPLELLHGVTFALFYACMTSYASTVAVPGTATTVQGAVGALFEIGASLGSFLGGLLYDTYGGPMTFRIFGFTALVAGVLHVLVHYFFLRFKDDPTKLKENISVIST